MADDDARVPDVSREPRRHHDPLAVRTVFVAPRRADRPTDLGSTGEPSPADCPFCAGNEALTPPDVLRMPAAPGRPWHARLIPNRFPVVEESAAVGWGAADAATRPAHGVHDVVIESCTHARSILEVDPSAWRDVWELCRRRIAMLAERGDLAWATVFKNSGPAAGASLEHLHSQLVALDFVPPTVAAELAAAGRAADPFGDALRQAAIEDRIVAEAGDLVALVPRAPRQPFEMLLLPRLPERHFHSTSAERVAALADLTRAVIGALDQLVPGAGYNWWLHQAPFTAHDPAALPPENWHWHLEILPRLANIAGFELGTGCHITTMSPAESARRLRAAHFSSPVVTPGKDGPPPP
jgi:UDPglucose--hexose-1-phosphate uridylyltransferase